MILNEVPKLNRTDGTRIFICISVFFQKNAEGDDVYVSSLLDTKSTIDNKIATSQLTLFQVISL